MGSEKIISENTWLGSNRRLAKTIGRPVRKFLGIEASSGILLVIAALVAFLNLLFFFNSLFKKKNFLFFGFDF